MDLSRFESLLRSRNSWVRSLLSVAERLYGWGQSLDRWRTDHRIRRGRWPKRLDVPVISIGNLVAGGVGKTPIVEAIARAHLERGGRPGILSRGYRSLGEDGNDEARLLSRRLAEVPHVQDQDRYAGGLKLLATHPDVDLILLDDGFQHRRLHRDVDLVVLDATRPFGWGRLLPAGYLREPWRGLRRADAVVVTRGADASRQKLSILRELLRTECRGRPVLMADTVVEGVRTASGREKPVKRGRRVAAFAGIGNPGAFFRTARRAGFDVIGEKSFADHHDYRDADLDGLVTWAQGLGAEALLCTEKDGVKLEALSGTASAAVPIEQVRMHLELDTDAILALVPSREERAPEFVGSRPA